MTIKRVVGVLLLSLAGAAAAHSNMVRPLSIVPNYPVSAPEIDPSSALSSLMLLTGSLAMIRGRVKK